MNKSDKSFSLKDIIEYGSFFYLLMAFLSFFQLHMFYNYFHVTIYYFTSTFELLFYFIPYFIINNIKVVLTLPVGVILSVLMTLIYIDNKFYNKCCLLWLLKLIQKKPNKVIKVIIAFCIIFIITGFFLWGYLIAASFSKDGFNDCQIYIIKNFINIDGYSNGLFQGIFIVWCLSLYFLWYPVFIKDVFNKQSIFLYSIFAIIFYIFIFYSLKTTFYIYKMDKIGASQDYQFNYLGKRFNTNDNLRTVGTSKEFIFIRDFQNKENYIYEFSKIDSLKITQRPKE